MAGYTIEVLSGQHVGARFHLNGEVITIGRDAVNVIRLEDNGVSRRHAQLSPADGKWIIEDLKSRNGTHVSGKQIERQPLLPGDEIAIGDAKLRFMTAIIDACTMA